MTFTVLHSVCRNERRLGFARHRMPVTALYSDSIILGIELLGQCGDCKTVEDGMQANGWQLVLNRLAFAVT